MSSRSRVGLAVVVLLALGAIVGSSLALSVPTAVSAHLASRPAASHATLTGRVLVSAPPAGAKGPDDLTLLSVPGVDHGRPVLWTAYQNGINPDGTPGSTGGPTQSTLVGYDQATGQIVRSINVTGKIDGLVADPAMNAILATVNEDDNSRFNVVYPALGAVATYSYAPNPAYQGVGGTDSIAVWDGQIYVAHSNPANTAQATEYVVTLRTATLTAQLTPLFYDDSGATSATNGTAVTLGLTDPDTNLAMPASSARFGGDLATISQGDGEIIFAHGVGHAVSLQVLRLTDNVSGNVPPADGLTVQTCSSGTLYVVDSGTNEIWAFGVHATSTGTIYIGEPNDNSNPLVGTLNPMTGKITPFGNHFVSPKGLLFVGSCGSHGGAGEDGHGHGQSQGDHDQGQGDDDSHGQNGHEGWDDSAITAD